MPRDVACRPGRGGSAALEFALSFVLLWTVLSGVFQFGYAMYTYENLAGAVTPAAPLTPIVAAFARGAASRNIDVDIVRVAAQRT